MKNLVVGIDPSSKKIALTYSLVEINKDKKIYKIPTSGLNVETIVFNKKNTKQFASLEAFNFSDNFCQKILKEFSKHPIHIYLESPVLGVNVHATIVQSFISGALQAGFAKNNLSITMANNTTWKKDVTGKGNHKKDEVSNWVKENHLSNYKILGEDQDLIDAYCIMLYGINQILIN